MSNSLLSGGAHYDLLINWEKRLVNEIPFLKSHFSHLLTAESWLLSVGCGTGHHLVELSKSFDCNLVGTDLDPSMILEAEKKLPQAKFIVGDFLDQNIIREGKFNAIYSLGNSIGLIAASKSSFEPVIEKLSQILAPNGILIFQILNTMKERNGWSAPRSIQTSEGEFVFLRGFTTSKRFIHPEIITLFRPVDNSDFDLVTTGRSNIPRITVNEMNRILERVEFRDTEVYGSYKRESFDENSSLDMIFVCRKSG